MEDEFETIVNTFRNVERKESNNIAQTSKNMKIYTVEGTEMKSHVQCIQFYLKN